MRSWRTNGKRPARHPLLLSDSRRHSSEGTTTRFEKGTSWILLDAAVSITSLTLKAWRMELFPIHHSVSLLLQSFTTMQLFNNA